MTEQKGPLQKEPLQKEHLSVAFLAENSKK
jgi:hypothetical protein